MGRLEDTGVWEPCDNVEPVSEERLLTEAAALLGSTEKRRVDPEADFLWESCLKECEKGWAAPPASRAAMDREYGAGRWAAVPSFVHVQQNGKRRRIDDAKAGGQNGATVYPEKWHLPSAFTPALYAKVLRQAWETLQAPRPHLPLVPVSVVSGVPWAVARVVVSGGPGLMP